MNETLTGTLLLVPRLATPPSASTPDAAGACDALRRRRVLTAPFLFAVGLVAVASYLTALLQLLADGVVVLHTAAHRVEPPPDIISELLPHIPRPVPAALVGVFLVAAHVRFLCTPLGPHIIRRLCFMQTVLLLFRGFSVLTAPFVFRGDCTPPAGPLPLRALLVVLGAAEPCTTFLFNPTAALLLQVPCVVQHYLRYLPTAAYAAETAAAWVLSLALAFLYACSSADLSFSHITGSLLAALVFHLYHFYLLAISTRNNYFNAFLRWFEQDAPDIPKLARLANRQQKLDCN